MTGNIFHNANFDIFKNVLTIICCGHSSVNAEYDATIFSIHYSVSIGNAIKRYSLSNWGMFPK